MSWRENLGLIPMLRLLSQRPRFGVLYLADAVSMIGDWLTYVAVGLLALRGPQGLMGVALVQMAHSLPQAFAAPLAGWLTDRVDRRTLLVVASVARGAVTLAMAGAAARGAIAWVEGLLFVRMAGAAFIMAPSRAALPQLVDLSQLELANRLIGASWAVFFTVGVALGGVVSGLLGPTTALAIDAATFGVAALIFAGLGALPPSSPDAAGRERSLLADAREHPSRVRAALAKVPTLFLNGAAWVVLHSLVGSGAGAAFGLGGLHAARGVGNGVGAWALARFGERRMVAVGVATTMAGGLALAAGPGPVAWVVGCVLWGAGVGATWVGATIWLQKEAPRSILGRYAALDVGAGGVASALGGLGAAALSIYLTPWLTFSILAGVSLCAFALVRPRAVAAAVLGLALCAPARAQPDLLESLAARAVTDDAFVRRELFTWTSREQADRLRADRVLLTSGPADGAARSPYQRALDAAAAGSGDAADLARALSDHPALARRRYAWSTPWGTAIPRGSRSYGSALVHLRIAEDALFVRFAPDEAEPFAVSRMDGRSVPLAEVVAHPASVGVVFHVRRDARLGDYREYIVHGHVAAWSIATPALRERLDAERRILRRLLRLRADMSSNARHWSTIGPSVRARFAATMPFDTARHRLSPRTLEALVERLRRRPRGPPLVVGNGEAPPGRRR